MNNDENKILALISKLDFSKAVYSEYGVKLDKSGEKRALTAVFSFENLTIEIYTDDIGCPIITKINDITVSINLDACDYYKMEEAAMHGTSARALKILENYLNA